MAQEPDAGIDLDMGADASRTVGDLGPNDAADWGRRIISPAPTTFGQTEVTTASLNGAAVTTTRTICASVAASWTGQGG